MTPMLCRECGKELGQIDNGVLRVLHKDRLFLVERGAVECSRYVRKGVRRDGTVIMAACATMNPVSVEVLEQVAV